MKIENSKKGFTLMELLAVIAIIAILLLILIPTVTTIIRDSKSNLHSEQEKVLQNAARMWYLESDVDLNNNESCQISVSTIVDLGYVEGDDVIDPKTGETMGGYVVIRYKDNQYTYTYKNSITVSDCE